MATLYLNDRNLADFKIQFVADPKGLMGPPPRSDRTLKIPGRWGELRVSREGDSSARHITVQAVMRATSNAEAETLWDAFLNWVGSDELEIRTGQYPDKIVHGYYEGIDMDDLNALYSAHRFTMSFACPDPLKYSMEEDNYSIASGSEVPLVLGSAPSDISLAFIGKNLSNPRVLYKDAQGITKGDLSFALFLDGSVWIEINSEYLIPKKYTGTTVGGTTTWGTGHWTDVPELSVTTGFVADPADGDAGQGPTLTAVNCDISARVRRAWR